MYLSKCKDKNVALVVNHTSLLNTGSEDAGQYVHLVDHLIGKDISVRRVFAPEHGFRGTADAGETITDGRDGRTGLPVVSLYGKNKKPTSAQLEGLDLVIFDLQDVGARFYTYISTLHYVMEACAESNIPLIVLDRPNPNGYYVDGPVLEPQYRSFVGMHPIPVVYGLTIGELAMMINGEGWLEGSVKCDLEVIPCRNYDHTMTYELPVPPSPNLPNHRSVLLYPSLCFFEGTTVSVGRGTDHQFQVIGHPGMSVGSYVFTPESRPGAKHPKYEGKAIYGTSLVGVQVADIMQWKRLNLQWLIGYYEYLGNTGEFFNENLFFDKLAGTDQLRKQIAAGMTEEQIRASWQKRLDHYLRIREQYLLYSDFISE